MAKMYLIETRNTVGAFRTVSAVFTKKNANEIFEEALKNNHFGEGYPEVHKLTSTQKKQWPDVIRYAKVGNEHHNIAFRIREVTCKRETF